MNERIRKLVRTNTVAYILLLLLFAAVTAKISLALAIGEVAAALAVWYISHRRSKVVQQQLHQYVERIAGGADTAKNSNMLFAPMPMMVFNPENDDVLWANDLFTDLPGVGKDIFESRVRDVVEGFETQLDLLFQGDAMDITADVEVLERMLAKDGLSGQEGMTLGL